MRGDLHERGFTMPELIAVMVILGVITAVAAPRMWGFGYHEAAFADEAMAALRYAQRSALSMQRTVCATFTATTVTFTYASAYGSATCDTPLLPPGGGVGPYVVDAQHGNIGIASTASFSPLPATLSFDRTGTPSAAATITLNGGQQIVIEAGSGYVH